MWAAPHRMLNRIGYCLLKESKWRLRVSSLLVLSVIKENFDMIKYIALFALPFFLFYGCSRPAENVSAEEAIDSVDLVQHIRVLSSDEFEGRAPSSAGETKTINYLAEQYKALGVQPGNGDSYFQSVPLISISASPDMSLNASFGKETKSYAFGKDFVAVSPQTRGKAALENSEVVFVGYGIVAPEYDWNDYKGLDVKGKTVLILVNDPGYQTQNDSLFTGNAMTYYGRWTYKFEEAGRQGAAGAIIIHQDGPAGYGWGVVENSWSGPQFYQAGNEDTGDQCDVQGWITEQIAAEWFNQSGLDLQSQIQEAAAAGFKAKSLGIRLSIAIENTVQRSESHNVIAAIPGKTRPDEYIIFTSHWDHLGKDTTLTGDQIYNGAFDNATGIAGLLEIAGAFMAAGQPERTVVFLPVTAEEQGLLGSAYYAASPVYPLEKTVAVINIDGLNIYGRMKDIIIIGHGNSELDQYVKDAAKAQDRVVKPDPQPEKGFYYRSDHFSFAKKGVPSLYTDNGVDHFEKGEEWTRKQMDAYTDEKYHKPGDEMDATWDLAGAIDDLRLFYHIADKLANNNDWPEWNEGVAFKAVREESR